MLADRRTLVFDADDTLWENNVLFERVIDAYLDWLAHPTLDRAATRAVLDEVERANVVVHGYGTESFLRSLHDCFERLSERPATAAEADQLAEVVEHGGRDAGSGGEQDELGVAEAGQADGVDVGRAVLVAGHRLQRPAVVSDRVALPGLVLVGLVGGCGVLHGVDHTFDP